MVQTDTTFPGLMDHICLAVGRIGMKASQITEDVPEARTSRKTALSWDGDITALNED